MGHMYSAPLSTSEKFFVVYLILHVFITVLIDSTIVLPKQYWLGLQATLHELHVTANRDPLVMRPPSWLKGYVWIELILQTPFFLWASVMILKKQRRVWPYMIIYGVEAATTTIGCIFELSVSDAISDTERYRLYAVYAPTFFIPVFIAWIYSHKITNALSEEAHLKLD